MPNTSSADADLAEFVRRLFDPRSGQEAAMDAQVARHVEEFLQQAIVGSGVEFETLSSAFTQSAIPAGEGAMGAYLERLNRDVVAHSDRVSSPRYIGHMTSALPYFVRPLSRLLTALNQNLVKVETSKALTPFERQAIAMIHRLIFARDESFYEEHVQNRASTLGVMTSGGTLANVTALWIARNRSLGPDGSFPGVERAGLFAAMRHYGAERLVLVGSTLMHYSLEKAADLLGLGTESSFLRVPIDARAGVRVDEMRKTAREALARGERITAIVGIAGTTDSGSIDPLDELADLAAELGVHFHVDAAWGGPLLFSPTHRHKLKGIERADSVTIDGHKQLYLPMGIGMVILRDPTSARAIEKQAQYIIRADSPDLGRRTLEGSRPGMALHLHAALHILGERGYAFLIDEGVRKARYLADVLARREAFELLVDPQMNIVNYRFVPASLRAAVRGGTLTQEQNAAINKLTERLQEAQRRTGETFVSRTTLRYTRYGAGVPVASLRAVIANPLTTESDIDEVLAAQEALGESLGE